MDKKPSSPKPVLSHIIDFFLKEGLTLITGAALGATISLALSYMDATDFWTMVGSMLAGLGTVGLLTFGWVKSDEWIERRQLDKRDDLLLSISLAYFDLSIIGEITEIHRKAIQHRKWLKDELERFYSEVYEEDLTSEDGRIKISNHLDANMCEYETALIQQNNYLADYEKQVRELLKSFESNIIKSNSNAITLKNQPQSLDVKINSTSNDIYLECVIFADTEIVDLYKEHLKEKIESLWQGLY